MTKEIAEIQSVSVDFQPSKIEIQNKELLENTVKEISERYKGLVYEEKADADFVIKKLSPISKGLDEKRKEIKRAYNEPLNVFEDEIKAIKDPADEVLTEARQAKKKFLEAEKEARKENLMHLLESEEDEGLDIDLVQIDDKWWQNATNWTKDFKPTKKLQKEIDAEISRAKEEASRRQDNKEIVKAYAEAYELDPTGWIGQLEYKETAEIMADINSHVEKEKAKAAAQKKKELEQTQQDELGINEVFETTHFDKEEAQEVAEASQTTKEITLHGTEKEIKEALELLDSYGYQYSEGFSILDDLPF